MKNGKKFLRQNNLMFAEKQELRELSLEYIEILKIQERITALVALQNFFLQIQNLIQVLVGQVFLNQSMKKT